MKTKIKRHSRSALSILLTVCMLISCMTVGLIATDAARANSGTVASNGTAVNRTVYVKQSAVSSTTYSDYRVWFAHTDNNLINELITMTDTGKTIGDDKVYSATIYDRYDGLNRIYFQAFNNDRCAAETRAVDKWTVYSTYDGKVWNGSSWEVPNWDTVYGVTGCEGLTGNNWGVTDSDNDMTKSGSSYTKTYNNVPAGSYEFKITKDHNWDNSVGYSSNVSFSGVAANNESSDENNIKFTTSVTSNITITFTPASAKADSFNFIVNNGSNERKSQDAKNYAAGHTYYVQWYGTGTNADVKKMGTNWYPKYYLAYKPSSAEDIAANWTRVAFSNSEATLSSLTAQNYVFYIVRQDMVSSSYEDHYWYNNGDKTITRSNRTNVYTTHNNNAPNITLTADAPGDYKVVFDAMNGDTAVTIHADYPVGYRAVGNATFFGIAWDTASSNYEYMLTEMASPKTIEGQVYTHSCSKKLNSSVGTFEFKVWDTNDD